MADRDWFRNATWNEAIASDFEAKLSRARRKDEYLYLQALTLAGTYPHVSLELLHRYFALNHRARDSQAHETRALAHLAMGEISPAILAYERALEVEESSPQILTQANLDLPYLIATHDLSSLFDRALEVLNIASTRLTFPVERFKYHTSHAIILATRGDLAAARTQARAALDAASLDESGFQHHPDLGLVSKDHTAGLTKLRGLCDA